MTLVLRITIDACDSDNDKGCDYVRKILVVEDDDLLNKTLSYNLTLVGYKVDSAISATLAKKLVVKEEYDLIVLDINLPDDNGFNLCMDIKSLHKNTAIIFLSANDMESDMIRGFELGADDYVTKPFLMSVFQKKVAALFNRIGQKTEDDYFDDGNLFINFSKMSARLVDKPLAFTPMEYRMLRILTKNAEIVLTRRVLLEKLWDNDEKFVDEHTLTSNISRIRNKIETASFQYIKTVYGMGYIWMGEKNEQ